MRRVLSTAAGSQVALEANPELACFRADRAWKDRVTAVGYLDSQTILTVVILLGIEFCVLRTPQQLSLERCSNWICLQPVSPSFRGRCQPATTVTSADSRSCLPYGKVPYIAPLLAILHLHAIRDLPNEAFAASPAYF